MTPPLRYVVPNTCALAASLYRETYSANASPLLNAIRSGSVGAVAPSVGLAEFLNVSRRKHQPDSTGIVTLSITDVKAVVLDFLTLPILWIEVDTTAAFDAWRWHQDCQLQPGDAFFLEIARLWQAEIWTTDTQFCNAAKPIYAATFDLCATPFS